MALLEVRDLRTYFRTEGGVARAVDGVSFSLEAGEVLGIVGESGSGKSVTSLSIMRLIPEPPGEILAGSSIRLNGEELVGAPERRLREIRGNDVAMIFQEPMTSLNPVFTVGDQIAEAVRLHRNASKKEARARAIELLGLVGIPDPAERVDAYPHELSGGQRQRVMIAVALSCEPDLLIADEPTTALDVTIQAQILELLGELRQRLGMAIMLITHDLGVVAEVCDRVVVLYAGEVMEEGPVEQIFHEPRHPYTQGLISSIPRLGQETERLAVIPGMVPSPVAWPVGCRFHTRCPYGWDLCVREHPELFAAGDGRAARCWLEKHPERRAEVDRTTGGFLGLAGVSAAALGAEGPLAVEAAPAEAWHQRAAGEPSVPAPEATPPVAPARPLAEDPDAERDVER
ncbi:MAG TPA: ABC transporter ATP-binding protein [Longimicrobiales bacterium]|nr:ABC transporter ATP-binding protein [Longimicrobiales bacterium]